MNVHVLGVRHHGPGSARSLRAELERLKPDVVLIEGPPEADGLVDLARDPDLRPPVALLAHVPGEPSKAAFWPFAVFSPEWQAIRYATGAGVPVRFCDLPAAHTLVASPDTPDAPAGEDGTGAGGDADAGADPTGTGDEGAWAVRVDPIGALARAAGYDDPERWWEDAVEHRGDTPFQVIAEAMAAVREGHVPDAHEARREAFMRRTVRGAVKDGFERIAVVCGAWHMPALTGAPGTGGGRAWGAGLPTAKADDALLRGLPKAKVETTWVPWTYGRLAAWSGYGAGVTSPGWYHHLFAAPDRPVERWLTEAAGVLRAEDLPVSSAHVIEAVRLARSLAVLRGRPLAGLAEVTEAARAVLCEGDDLPVELIGRRMVVGERLGHVPDATPMVPLQRHLRAEQRRLRLKPEASERDLDLDLRKPLDLERSRLLHRLRLLGVGWGRPRESTGKGTFRESWTLAWRPEFDIDLIEAGAWGTTVPAAAATRVRDLASAAASLADLTALVERCLLADLPEALPGVLDALSARAALDGDVTHLMAALPAMVRAQRYGDVRGTPAGGLSSIAEALLTRICVGLAAAAAGLDDDAARDLVGHVDAVHTAVGLLDPGETAVEDGPKARWLGALRAVSRRSDLHGLIEGRLVRILLDAGDLDTDRAERRMSRAMSAGHPPARAAAWIEGFTSGGGLLLVHDARLLGLVDGWLSGLAPEAFVDVLPLLRRAFGAFAAPERRSIGERVRGLGRGAAQGAAEADDDVDDERAAAAVRTVLAILGRA
ncbi:hypothetical protein Ppa06_40740 [Planomonospora parontospora subsp. parontospora]|uniref:Uncharacterized protein n=2 Tax=Planomonospora parontospora TaxID=58119 RepID=A0AA37F630_9ACTN|nr:DUF5682 family protein [Planomonospora parontospora]GGK78830.1 hypothetical protein GCM10010126_42810 [Planomonospora parontospora]GII10276.1 hypothetical protein Ppa06_40740 [Planomonospora parontospora subsp. parontospora]